jgi:AcrR family transcriptional regulator
MALLSGPYDDASRRSQVSSSAAVRVEPLAARGRQSTRDALLDAVDELLVERGWSGCSLQALARRAGLTTGAVYSTFGSRGALIAAAMVRRTDGVSGLPVDEPDLGRAVSAYARTFHALGSGPAGANLLTVQLDLLRLSTTDPSLGDAMKEAYAGLLARLVADIEARAGRRRLPASAEVLAQRMVAVLQGLTLQAFALGQDFGEQSFVDAALTAIGLPAGR